MHLQGIRALAAVSGADMTIGVMCTLRGAVSGADMTIGVMCTLRGAQVTETAAQLGLILMSRLRF